MKLNILERKSIRWLLLESSAIVLSILLAFAIDAWWQNHQDREMEQALLRSVTVELAQNIEVVDRELKYRYAVKDSINRLFMAAGGEPALGVEDVDELLSDLTWWGEAGLATGVIDSLLLSGNLALISSAALRHELAALPSHYDRVSRTERQDYETLRNVVMPFLSANANVPQIARHATTRPGHGEQPPYQVDYRVERSRDHRALLEDDHFLSILVQTD